MTLVRTLIPTFAAALLAAGCATTPGDTAALAASVESIGHWGTHAAPARTQTIAAEADAAQLPVVSQAGRR